MELNMDALSVKWKLPNEKEWRGAYELSERWKGKKVYVFVAMGKNGDCIVCEMV
jgi:hypothetical protein